VAACNHPPPHKLEYERSLHLENRIIP
jgi:hypothetical protein